MLFELLWTDSPSLGESASPFIDEGDGLTRERERVRMLLSLVAHAIGYKMIVGAHNIVDVGGFYRVLHVGQMMAPTTLLVSRGMWGEPYRACHGMGVDGTHNTIGQMSVPTTLLGF